MQRRLLRCGIMGVYVGLGFLSAGVQDEPVGDGRLMARKLMLMSLRQEIGVPLICSALGMVGCAGNPLFDHLS
jgi:hypothetical protein